MSEQIKHKLVKTVVVKRVPYLDSKKKENPDKDIQKRLRKIGVL